MKIGQIVKDLSSMTKEELYSHLEAIRKDRVSRTPTAPKGSRSESLSAVEKRKKKATNVLAGLSQADPAIILAQLETEE